MIDVWENYLSVKGDRLSYNSLNTNVKSASLHLDYAKGVDPSCIYLDNIDKFVNILKGKYTDGTLLNDFTYYNSACNLAMKQGKINKNSFSVYLDNISKTPINGMGAVLCFTKEEKDLIIKTFYDNPYPILNNYYRLKDGTKKPYYSTISKERALIFAPLIELKFLTGLRPGEAHALKWSDIKEHP